MELKHIKTLKKKKKSLQQKVHIGHLQHDVRNNVLKKHPYLHKPLLTLLETLKHDSKMTLASSSEIQ